MNIYKLFLNTLRCPFQNCSKQTGGQGKNLHSGWLLLLQLQLCSLLKTTTDKEILTMLYKESRRIKLLLLKKKRHFLPHGPQTHTARTLNKQDLEMCDSVFTFYLIFIKHKLKMLRLNLLIVGIILKCKSFLAI